MESRVGSNSYEKFFSRIQSQIYSEIGGQICSQIESQIYSKIHGKATAMQSAWTTQHNLMPNPGIPCRWCIY